MVDSEGGRVGPECTGESVYSVRHEAGRFWRTLKVSIRILKSILK